MSKKRDNFKQPVINKLAKRVSYRCSNPDCRAQTVAGSSSTDEIVSIGVAAHITAAASGGPRFDPNIDSQQRASYANGIWLCQNCSRKIDADFKSYSTDTLKKWKQEAEASSIKSLGNKTYTEEEHNREFKSKIIDISTSKKSLTNGVFQEKMRLESLDQRFCVDVSVNSDGSIFYKLTPREKVSFCLNVLNNENYNINDFRSFLDYGGVVEIPSENFSITGINNFPVVGESRGKLTISQKPRKCEMSLVFVVENGEDYEFQYFDAEVFVGKLGSNIKCRSKSKLIEMDLLYHFNSSLKFNLRFNFDSLIGKGVYHIPYFARYLKAKNLIFNNLVTGVKLVSIIDGVDYEIARSESSELINYLRDFAKVIFFIEMVVKYSKLTGVELRVNDFNISRDSYEALKSFLEYSSVESFDFYPGEKITESTIDLNEDVLNDFEKIGIDSYRKFGDMRFSKTENFVLFGNVVNSPEFSIYYNSVDIFINKDNSGAWMFKVIPTEQTKIFSMISNHGD